MGKVEDGHFVQVHYKGTLENGDVFDTSEGRAPLEFQVGKSQVVPGFENAIKGMELNEKKTFNLSPAEAYGERNDSLIQSFARKDVPPDFKPEVGQTVALHAENGQQVPAIIIEMDEEQIKVDINHPLAGKALTFEIEIAGISDTSASAGCACGCDGDCSTPNPSGCGGGCGSGGCS